MPTQSIYKEIINQLAEKYRREENTFLTENDIVIHLAHMLINEGKTVHSELRPWIPECNKIIKGDKWTELERLNRCVKVDVAVTDPNPEYLEQALTRIKGQRNQLKYWRILLYPLKGFKAVFEVKIRVEGNLKRIYKDIEKLNLMHRRNKDCNTLSSCTIDTPQTKT